IPGPSLGAEQHDLSLPSSFPAPLDGLEERRRKQHHAFAAAIRPVVNGLVLVFGEVTQIDDPNVHELRGARPAQNNAVEEACEQLRKDRYDIKLHSFLFRSISPAGRSTRITFSATDTSRQISARAGTQYSCPP